MRAMNTTMRRRLWLLGRDDRGSAASSPGGTYLGAAVIRITG
jgi:hypothetical protein